MVGPIGSALVALLGEATATEQDPPEHGRVFGPPGQEPSVRPKPKTPRPVKRPPVPVKPVVQPRPVVAKPPPVIQPPPPPPVQFGPPPPPPVVVGEHQSFYSVTTPCPTQLQECTDAYIPAGTNPATDTLPTPIGEVQCGTSRFPVLRSHDDIIVMNGRNPLMQYLPQDTHHILIACGPSNHCKPSRYDTREDAVNAVRAMMCAPQQRTPDGEMVRVELRVPFSRFNVFPPGVTDHSYELTIAGFGLGVTWRAPKSWAVPILTGVGGEWLGDQGSSAGSEINFDRVSAFAEFGIMFSSEWLRKILHGDTVDPWPVNISLEAAYRGGYEFTRGDYQFDQGDSYSFDAGGWIHHPAVMVKFDFLIDDRDISAMGFGFDQPFAPLGRKYSEVDDGVYHHVPVVAFGFGQYAITNVLPTPTLSIVPPSAPVALEPIPTTPDLTSVPEVVRPDAVKLLPIALSDSWGHVHATTLLFKIDGETFRGKVGEQLAPFVQMIALAAKQRPHAQRIVYIRYVAHTDSIGEDDYNARISRERAKAQKTLLNDRLNAHPDLQGLNITVDSVGLGESLPRDRRGELIDTAGCKEVEIERRKVFHQCGNEEIPESLGKSRRLEIIVQFERDDLAIRLHRGTAPQAVINEAATQRAALALGKRVVSGGAIAYPLSVDETDVASFVNFEMLRNVSPHRFVSVILSGKDSVAANQLPDRLLPALRSARHANIEIFRTAAPLGTESQAYLLVHPKQKIDLTSDAGQAILQGLKAAE